MVLLGATCFNHILRIYSWGLCALLSGWASVTAGNASWWHRWHVGMGEKVCVLVLLRN